MKKVLIYLLSMVTVAALAIGGTLAYLTSEDQDVNVMTMGNVQIDQREYERTFDEKGNVTGMKEYTPGQALYPAVATNGATANQAWAPNPSVDIYYKDYLGEKYPGGNGTWQNLNNTLDKFVFVENTGESDAYYRTIILLEADTTGFKNSITNQTLIHLNTNGHQNFTWFPKTGDVDGNTILVEVGGVYYNVVVATYNAVLTPGEISRPSLLQVGMDQEATNEHCAQFGDTYDILVLSQAVQTKGFDNATQALDTAFGEVNATNVADWFDGVVIPNVNSTFVNTADELKTAVENGGEITLNKDIELDADNTVTIKKGTSTTLNLNGHTLSAVSNETGSNRNLFDVNGGELTVENGTVTFEHEGTNMEWNASTNNFNVTAGGVLNIKNATIKNVGGSDMAFCVHLNNWGEVTLNIENSKLESIYVPVRVFNSGYDMNNVIIKNSTLKGVSAAFWVHNYTAADFGTQEKADEQVKLLNFNIFNGTNEFVHNSSSRPGPIRLGMTDSICLDKNGNEVK